MMIFKKAIPRRTVLKGAGATLALPLLDSMVPALAASQRTAAKPVPRLAFVYHPNGMIMENFRPKTEGDSYELTPILEPLAPFRNRFSVVSGLCCNAAYGRPGDNEGDAAPHERIGGTFLTGVHPTRWGQVDTSVDQIAARHLGKYTQLASLEMGLHNSDVVGQCEKGWNCGYLNTLSWSGPTTPLPTENNPRIIFERLFGDADSTDPTVRLARIQKNRSLLDSVMEAASQLQKGLGASDRRKLSEYFDATRDVERRIQVAEEQSSRELPTFDRPTAIPAAFDEHAKLMFDLQVLAFQTDLTRMITFMMGREQSDRTFRECGVADAHHGLTHHQNDPVKIAKVTKINIFHSQMFAYLLEKLQSTPDGDGSLLDHCMVVYGGGISNGNGHDFTNLPIVLAGGQASQIKAGRHIRFPQDTPIANLYVTLLDKLGVPVDRFGDSNGALQLSSVG